MTRWSGETGTQPNQASDISVFSFGSSFGGKISLVISGDTLVC
jgi:hypothetical protein